MILTFCRQQLVHVNLANVIEKTLMRPQMVVNPARGLAGTICEVYIHVFSDSITHVVIVAPVDQGVLT